MAIEVLKRHNATLSHVDPRLGLFVAVMFGIGIASLFPFVSVFRVGYAGMDFGNFWSGGGTAGTSALIDPVKHVAWQIANHVKPGVFVYIPGFAWYYAPFARLPLMSAYVLNDVLLGSFCFVIVVLAAHVYSIKRSTAFVLIAAWYPILYTVELGQNTLFALAFILLAIAGVSRNKPIVSGLAIGALMYKPTDALVFLLFLLVRKDVKALAVALTCAALWYLISVPATAGDWAWPVHYSQMIAGYYRADFSPNAFKAFSLPMLLMALGTPNTLSIGIGLLLSITMAVFAARVSPLEGASMLPLAALASSAHAWPYELAILIPTIIWTWLYAKKPMREWVLATAYFIAATWWLTIWKLGFDPIAVIILGGAALWGASLWYRRRSYHKAAGHESLRGWST